MLHVIAFFCVIPIQREVEVNGCDGMKQNSFQPPTFRSQARLRLTAGQVTPWDFFPDPANGISDSLWPAVAQDKGHACEVTGLPPGTGTQRPRGRLVHSLARLCPGQQSWLGMHLRPPRHCAQQDGHLGAKEARSTETRVQPADSACSLVLPPGASSAAWLPGEAARSDGRGAGGGGRGAGRPGSPWSGQKGWPLEEGLRAFTGALEKTV